MGSNLAPAKQEARGADQHEYVTMSHTAYAASRVVLNFYTKGGEVASLQGSWERERETFIPGEERDVHYLRWRRPKRGWIKEKGYAKRQVVMVVEEEAEERLYLLSGVIFTRSLRGRDRRAVMEFCGDYRGSIMYKRCLYIMYKQHNTESMWRAPGETLGAATLHHQIQYTFR